MIVNGMASPCVITPLGGGRHDNAHSSVHDLRCSMADLLGDSRIEESEITRSRIIAAIMNEVRYVLCNGKEMLY